MNLSLGFGLDKYRVQDATLLNPNPDIEIKSLLDSVNASLWLNPTADGAAIRDVGGAESVWFDMMVGSALRGAEQSSGDLVAWEVYEITATETNFFFTGCAVGNIFSCSAVKTCTANNKVKKVLGNHVGNSPQNVSKQPINSLFDGSNDFLRSAAFTVNQPASVFIVFKQKSWTINEYLFSGLGTSNRPFLQQYVATPSVRINAGTYSGEYTYAPIDELVIGKAFFNGASSRWQINNNLYTNPYNSGTTGFLGLILGSDPAESLPSNVEIKEFILIPATVSLAFELQLTTLLANKWAISADLPAGPAIEIKYTQGGTLGVLAQFYTLADNGANIYVSWGDGTIQKLISDGTLIRTGHTFRNGINSQMTMKIGGELEKLKQFKCYDAAISFDITEFGKAVNLEVINLNGVAPLEAYGDISVNTKLKQFWCPAPSVVGTGIYGNIDNCPLIEVIECQGQPSNWHFSRVTGNFANIPNLKQHCCVNNIGGDISSLANLEYFEWGWGLGVTAPGMQVSNTVRIWGDISDKVNLWTFAPSAGSETITGSTALLVNLESFFPPPAVTKPATVNHLPKLSRLITPAGWVLTEAEVNQYLADFWANREVVRVYLKNTPATPYGVGNREIGLDANASNAAPTGQGITDKANLQATKSPADPGTGSFWTVRTN